jgi:glycosyltransferase involved in cell wall biosynthesis
VQTAEAERVPVARPGHADRKRDHAPRAMNRVLHVLAPGREGGLERVVTMLATGQARRGEAHVAAVLSPADAHGHPFVERLRGLGIAVTPIVVGGRGYWREYRALRELTKSLRPSVVHTHGYRADGIAGIVARQAGLATVSTVHGFTGGRPRIWLNERVQCIALRYAHAVVAVSRPLVDRLTAAGIPGDRIHCVANGYLESAPLLSRDEARRRLGISRGACVAGWVGRLSHEKGPDVILEALAAADPAWQLAMIGEGSVGHALRERAVAIGVADRIVWHGAVPDAASLFTAFDAFVLSSRTEGTPIALLEAMAARVPIVATRVGGVPDVVGEAEALLVPSERPDAIAGALASLRRDPRAAEQRCGAAYERLHRGFGFDAWLDEIDRVYHAARERI